MINIRRDILTPVSLLLLGWGASSCTSEEFKDQLNPGDGVPTLGISIGVSAPTRSDGGGSFEPGVDLENYLDIAGDDYRIYFFDSDNKYIATFNPSLKSEGSVTPTTDGVDTYYYSFKGRVPAGVGTKFKLVVFANWGKYPEENTDGSYKLEKGVTTLANLVTHTDAQFNHLSSPGEGNWLSKEGHRLIPFYGVRSYDISEFPDVKNFIKDGKLIGDVLVDLTSDENALPLIRAMAKVEVILTNPLASFSSVKMTKVNDKGFNSPYKSGDDWKFDYTDYFHKYEWNKDFVRGVHLVGGINAPADQDGSLEFKKVSDYSETTPEKWVAYVPEYKNIGVGEEYTAITVTLAEPKSDGSTSGSGTDGTGDTNKPAWGTYTNTIYFAQDGSSANNEDGASSTTKRYDIERNNIYRFTITGMNANMECQLDVQPYAEQKLVVDLGLMRDESGDLMVVPDSKENLPDFFIEYMNNKQYPADSNGIELKPEVAGDYYAIRLPQDGNIQNAEVWLKDVDGCKVLTSFGATDGSETCNTRKVKDYAAEGQPEYDKDRDGDQRLQHNDDHSSIVIDHDKTMYYKTKPNDESNPVRRYRVESWDQSSGSYWYWGEITDPMEASEDNIKTALGVTDIPDQYRYLLDKDENEKTKQFVTVTLYLGNKSNPEIPSSDRTKILEEYTEDLKALMSSKAYKVE